jgi:hypothetical protein
MTDLSRAAQAVLDAANNSSAYGPEDCLNEARQIAAAALRAAAEYLSYGHGSWKGPSAIINEDELLAVASELEQLDD